MPITRATTTALALGLGLGACASTSMVYSRLARDEVWSVTSDPPGASVDAVVRNEGLSGRGEFHVTTPYQEVGGEGMVEWLVVDGERHRQIWDFTVRLPGYKTLERRVYSPDMPATLHFTLQQQDAAVAPATDAAPPSLQLTRRSKAVVLPLRARTGVDATTADLLTNLLLSSLDHVDGLGTLGRSDIEAMLSVERQKEALGCDDTVCFAELGGALGAELVVYGEVGRLGRSFSLSLSVVRASDNAVEGRASKTAPTVEELGSAMGSLTAQLLRKLVKG